jgi:hypothetical protein
VVEGQFNATITAHLTGAVAVGISGHVNYPAARPTLEALQAEGHDVLMIALDADDPAAKATTVRQVEASRQALAAAACALGYAVRFARWEHAAGKGMDDLLLAGGAYAIEPYHPALAEQQPVPADDDQQEPPPVDETAAGYQWSVIRTLIRNPAKVTLRNKQKGTRTVHHLTPTDMAVYMAAMVRYSLYPDRGATERPANPPMQRINVGFLASDAGVTPNSVSASLKRLHALGLLTITPHDVYHDDIQSWRTVLLAGKGRELGWNEQLPTDERRAADSARKRRCPHCHGARLVEHTLQCKDCLKTCTVAEAEQAATDAARAEAGDAAGQNAPHMDTPVDNRDPSTESVEPPDDDEDLAAALAAMVRQTADPEALAAHVDALRGDPRWAELSEVARRRVLRAAEHWREHLERTVAAPTVAPPPDHSVGGSTNSVTVPLEAEEHASLCMENVEPSAQPLPDHSAGGSPESVQACAPAPPGELSPTAAALIAHLQAVRYPDALAREWHWLSGPGGRRYQDLPPEERAAVAAAYQACATRWEARAS